MYRRPFLKLSAIVGAIALVAAGCGASSPSNEASASNPAPSGVAAEEAALNPGQVAPLLLPLSDGGQLDWNSLEGIDVMLWFWAPW